MLTRVKGSQVTSPITSQKHNREKQAETSVFFVLARAAPPRLRGLRPARFPAHVAHVARSVPLVCRVAPLPVAVALNRAKPYRAVEF